MNQTMRAIRVARFGGPEMLKLVSDVAVTTPAAHQVLIKVSFAGVNPVETYIRSGQYARLPELPFTPGSDLAGVIAEVGAGVAKFKPGDRVFTVRTDSGSYAEFALAAEAHTFPLHENLAFDQGAALGVPYFTAYKALHIRGGMKKGETVFIHGASGSVGLACVQIARAHGCHVIGTASSARGSEAVTRSGAERVFNHKEAGYMDLIKREYPDGVDVLVEMLADVNLQRDMDVMAYRGRIVIVGSRGSLEFTPRGTMAKELDIRGMILWMSTEAEIASIGDAIVAGCAAGWVRPEVASRLPVSEAARAHEEVLSHPGGSAGRIVLDVTQ